MTKQTKMTKKIKILVAIILSIVTIVGGIFISLSLIKTSYIMEFNNPDKIIVYYYSQTNNIVYKPGDDEYQAICTMIHDAHKQTMLTSIFNGQLFKDVNIVEHNSQNIKYDGIKINFVYNMPQIAKLKNKIYSSHIWYHNLIFEISAEDNFIYQSTAIISNKNNDVEMLSYQSHYLTYANYNCLYNYLKNIFN